MLLEICILVCVSFLIGYGISKLVNIVNDMEDRIEKLEAQLASMNETQAKRLPHNSAAAIEDSISTILNAKRLHEELKQEVDAMGFWLDKGTEYLRGARGNTEYDANTPSGNKVKRK